MQSSSPFFSIVTISFNQADYLQATIESVINQSYTDYEYIIQDPGSTDGSRDIINSYSDYLTHILYQSDSGPADGLNKAFSMARGRYYIFLNSDDTLVPNALQKLHDMILRDDSSHDVFSGASRIINSNGSLVRIAYSDNMSLRRAAFGQCILLQPSTVFSASKFKLVGGFNPVNTTNWDGELFVDMALAGCRFKRSSEILSEYRIHPKGITGSGRLHEEHIKYQSKIFELINQKPWHKRSKLLGKIYWLERRLLNIPDTIQRILKGPIFGKS